MDHVGVVVEDLAAAVEFFLELGLEKRGGGTVEGEWVERIIGLDDVHVEMEMLQTRDGQGKIELIRFNSPQADGGEGAPANVPGIRHIAFIVEDIGSMVAGLRDRGTGLVGELVRYGNSFQLCYVRGPEGIIIELAEPVGS